MLGTADPQGVTSVTLGSRAITFSGEKPFFSAQKALAQLLLRLAATGRGPAPLFCSNQVSSLFNYWPIKNHMAAPRSNYWLDVKW